MKTSALRRFSIRFKPHYRESDEATEDTTATTASQSQSLSQTLLPNLSEQVSNRRPPPQQQIVSGICALPVELLKTIASFADPISVICLSSTCRRLRQVFSPIIPAAQRDAFSRCAKWYLMALLERATGISSTEKLTCVLCKTKLSPSSFERRTSPSKTGKKRSHDPPRSMIDGVEHLHLLSRDPLSRFCEHHAKRTVLGRESSSPLRNSNDPIRWECRRRAMCLHCGDVPVSNACSCQCDVCPKDHMVPTFVRYGPCRVGESPGEDLTVFFTHFGRDLKMVLVSPPVPIPRTFNVSSCELDKLA